MMKIKKAVIPAAGFGTRMLPATATVPKEMLPIVDRPVLHYIVEEAAQAGIEEILIISARGKGAMEDYFDYHPAIEEKLRASGRDAEADSLRIAADLAKIHFIRQKETRGLGHAISCARSFVGDEPFAVLSGDDIMKASRPVIGQLMERFEDHPCSIVGVQEVSDEAIRKYCSLDVSPLEDRLFTVSRMIEKPKPEQKFSNYAILGRYLLTPTIFDVLERTAPGFGGEIQLTDAINTLCSMETVLALDFDGRRYDSGNVTGFLETTIDFALEHPVAGPWLRKFLKEKVKSL